MAIITLMIKPFSWDDYSDQPALLQDRTFKKSMRKKELPSLLYTFLSALVLLPLSILATPFVKRKEIESKHFFSLGIDFQRDAHATADMIKELGVESILTRFKLWEMEKLPQLKEFLSKYKNKKITLKILQDRENIKDLALLRQNLTQIFQELDDIVDIFEIGSTINRAKWGFFSVREYLTFYKVAYNLKQKRFPNIKIIGSGVIDFEFHYTAHTLFNFCKCRYDAIAALLYVDRRGAPENTQLLLSLTDKLALLSTMVWLSPKAKQELHITEVNWPLSGTAPYAPTSEYECISEEVYANYMLRYYLLAFASQQVDSVSWHQLIAPGYGLVDNRGGIKKREAFYVYKQMIQTLQNAQFLRLDIKRGHYIIQLLVDEQLLQIHWSLKPTTLKNEDFFEVYSKTGECLKNEILDINDSPVYIFITKEVGKRVNASERIK